MAHKQPVSAETTRTVTRTAVRTALARATPQLEAAEEQLLRMEHGVSPAAAELLPRVGQDHAEAREKLLSIELELLRQFKERQVAARAAAQTVVTSATPQAAAPSPRRDRIVQALSQKPRR